MDYVFAAGGGRDGKKYHGHRRSRPHVVRAGKLRAFSSRILVGPTAIETCYKDMECLASLQHISSEKIVDIATSVDA